MPEFVNQFALVDFLSYLIPGAFFLGYEYWFLDDPYRILIIGPADVLFPENELVRGISFVAYGYIAGMLLGMLGSKIWDILYREVSKISGRSFCVLLKEHMKFFVFSTICGILFYPTAQLFSMICSCLFGNERYWQFALQLNLTVKEIFINAFAGFLFSLVILKLGEKNTESTSEKRKKLSIIEKERKVKLYKSFHLMFRGLSMATIILLFHLCCAKIEVLQKDNSNKTFIVILYCLLVLFVSRGMQYRKYYEDYFNEIMLTCLK